MGQDTYQRTNQELVVQPGGYFYATGAVSKHISLGLALTTPYGYHTKWPSTWEGRSVVQESQLSTYFAQPTMGIKLNENFSADEGFVYAFGKYTQRHALGQYDDTSANIQYSTTGSGIGLNAGLYGRTGDNLAFGISYRSGIKLKMNNGTATTTDVPTRDAALNPTSADFKTQINLPSTLSVGIADRITKNLLLTFDFTLSGWSTLDSLNFDVVASGNTPARHIGSTRRYEDALSFRIGAEYQVTPQLVVLGGVHYDERPVRDEYINPDFLDANRIGASAGLSYQLSRRLAIEGAYSFDYGQLRTGRTNPTKYLVPNVGGTYPYCSQLAQAGQCRRQHVVFVGNGNGPAGVVGVFDLQQGIVAVYRLQAGFHFVAFTLTHDGQRANVGPAGDDTLPAAGREHVEDFLGAGLHLVAQSRTGYGPAGAPAANEGHQLIQPLKEGNERGRSRRRGHGFAGTPSCRWQAAGARNRG